MSANAPKAASAYQTTRLAAFSCPHCECINGAATSMEGRLRPFPGALAICFACGGVGFFTEALTVRKIDQAEIDAMPLADQNHLSDIIASTQKLIREAKKDSKKRKKSRK